MDDSTLIEIRVSLDSLFHNSKFGNPKFSYRNKDGIYFYDQDSILIDSVRFEEIDSTYTPDTVLTVLYDFSVPDSSELEEISNNGWTYQFIDSNIVRVDTSGLYMVFNGDSSSMYIQFTDSTNLLMYTRFQSIIEGWYYPKKEVTKSATRFLYGSGTATKYVVRSDLVYDGNINQMVVNPGRVWKDEVAEQEIGIESHLSISPNPVHESLAFIIKGENLIPTIQYAIYDIYGQRIMGGTSKMVGLTNHSIDVSGLTSGSYILKYNSEDFHGYVKFIKID